MVANGVVGQPTMSTNASDGTKTSKMKKPRKLVEKEEHQTGLSGPGPTCTATAQPLAFYSSI